VFAAQVLAALASLVAAPLVGLFSHTTAFFAASFGLAGLAAAILKRTPWASAAFMSVQVLALAGLLLTALPGERAPTTTPSAAATPSGAPIPATDLSAP
jgi:hypothetical protein